MLERLFSLDWRRRRLLAKAPEGPYRDYLAVPFAAGARDWRAVGFVALDLETTGLDAGKDEILSAGWVELHGPLIALGSARHCLVRPQGQIPEASAVIHQITDEQAARGMELAALLAELLPVLAGKVMIAHHARVELGFLGAACRRLYGLPLVVPTVDTEWLARRSLERRNQPYRGKELRLGALRERYNLPRYRAHDALSDALAASELFAAQVAERAGAGALPLKHLLLKL